MDFTFPDLGPFWLVITAVLLVVASIYFRITDRRNKKIRDEVLAGQIVSMQEFEKNWNVSSAGLSRKEKAALKREDKPGVYIILLYDHPIEDGDKSDYQAFFVGRSERTGRDVHGHFTGSGNQRVYKDIVSGRHAYVIFEHCSQSEGYTREKKLSAAFGSGPAISYSK